MNRHIFFSPHLDDAVYSCGGIIHHFAQRGDPVEIWTVFTADAPDYDLSPFVVELHQRWGNEKPYQTRRQEDELACDLLGSKAFHMDFPDCIYRHIPGSNQPIIKVDEDLFSPIQLSEQYLVDFIRSILEERTHPTDELYCPLAIGGHVDHRIVRAAAEGLAFPLNFYPDFPYASYPGNPIQAHLPELAEPMKLVLSSSDLEMWKVGIAAYTSQLSSFWNTVSDMREKLSEYATSDLATTIWICK